MTVIELTVTGAFAKAKVTGKITAGMVGCKVCVKLDTAWDGLTPTLVAKSGGGATAMVIDGYGWSEVPHERCIGGARLLLGIDGKTADGKRRIPTVWADCGIVAASPAEEEPEESVEPTPSLVDQIAAQAHQAALDAAIAQEVARQAEAGEFDGFSPTAEVVDGDDVVTVTITDKDGAHSFTVPKDASPELVAQTVAAYFAEHPIVFPVQSVNGKTGAVVLNAEDVGALPEGYHDESKQNKISDLDAIRAGASAGATALQEVPGTYRTAAAQDVIDRQKQPVINDLPTIRAGAAAGATALQKEDLVDLDNRLSESIVEIKEDIVAMNDSKISKFYANNLGASVLEDSDSGMIQDMILYGRSVQDGTPSPDAPVEIRSVANPVVTMCGKNLIDIQNPDFVNSTVTEGTVTRGNNEISLSVDRKTSHTWNAVRELWYLPAGTYTLSVQAYSDDSSYIPMIGGYTFKTASGTSSWFMRIEGDGRETFKFDDGMFLGLYFHLTTDKGNPGPRTVRWYNIQLERGSEATDFEPYTEKKASLPYTLHGVPVSTGGNVTIDGQQYIADYVDITNKKLVRCTHQKTFTKITNSYIVDMGAFLRFDINNPGDLALTPLRLDSTTILCKQLKNEYGNMVGDHEYCRNSAPGTVFGLVQYISKDRFQSFDLAGVNEYLKNHPLTYLIAIEPEETDLTDEEVQLFKELAAYYPTTNVSVTSDQLDGYTTFNYPISLAKGWNYVKQQLGDTRDYIYDMDLLSAEAYVNSEYAVALAELEV